MDETVISIAQRVEEVRPWAAALNAAVALIEEANLAFVPARNVRSEK
jgi:hypothetical protein